MSTTNLKKYKYMLKYGKKIKVELAKMGKKQIDLANYAGVSEVTVSSSWIKQSKKPHRVNARKICEFFQGNITYKDMGVKDDYKAENI
jgi:transcriptional regulator with XRE-family HTH domain